MELELLFEINAEIAPPPIVIPDTPDGTRVVVHVSGGKFEGPRLRGTVLASGGDWFLMRSDGVGVIDVRLVLKTDDSESIYMTYTGRAKLSAGGLTGDKHRAGLRSLDQGQIRMAQRRAGIRSRRNNPHRRQVQSIFG
jgi:hypothetical protein